MSQPAISVQKITTMVSSLVLQQQKLTLPASDQEHDEKIIMLDLHQKLDGRTYWTLVGFLSVEIKRNSSQSAEMVNTYETIARHVPWVSKCVEPIDDQWKKTTLAVARTCNI